jgi:hypothetical protein
LLGIARPSVAAPGLMLPLSNELSLKTIRCTTLSLLRNTSMDPCAAVAGLGLNDCAPRSPTIAMVVG